MYGFRLYFASDALGNSIPITDVAEWMGRSTSRAPGRPRAPASLVTKSSS
ncbi:hypothetical protein GCM10010230_25720 [Streptomyces narbonensis]|nr:hypothetical protein [Streptomyces narbonensis]GGV99486.1 hypothetical protein GCM10010230_25720 [Streptomyces narbonensis]